LFHGRCHSPATTSSRRLPSTRASPHGQQLPALIHAL
jgi:hypothetical protein